MKTTIAIVSACAGALFLSLSILPVQAEGKIKNKDEKRQGITDNNSPLPRDRASRTKDAGTTAGRPTGVIRLEPVGSSLKKN